MDLWDNPALDPLKMANEGEQFLPVSTTAAGFLYNTLIISIKGTLKPIASSTHHKNGHSRRSKAFIAFNEMTAAGELRFWAPSMTCSSSLHYPWLVWICLSDRYALISSCDPKAPSQHFSTDLYTCI